GSRGLAGARFAGSGRSGPPARRHRHHQHAAAPRRRRPLRRPLHRRGFRWRLCPGRFARPGRHCRRHPDCRERSVRERGTRIAECGFWNKTIAVRVDHSAFRVPRSAFTTMDYLTVALVLIAIGATLLVAEILLPTGGILVVGALLFFAIGVGTILYYGDTLEAIAAMAGLAVGLPATGFVAVAAYRRMSLRSALDASGSDGLGTDLPQPVGLDALKGRLGKALSPLRPSGAVEFDGRRVDAMSEGMMIDAGTWVRCVDIRGATVVVREMEPPKDITYIELDEPRRPPTDEFNLD